MTDPHEVDIHPPEHETAQMHLDEFFGEIIGIGKIAELRINFFHEADLDKRVHVTCAIGLPSAIGGGYYDALFQEHANTVGWALRKVREEIRNEAGK